MRGIPSDYEEALVRRLLLGRKRELTEKEQRIVRKVLNYWNAHLQRSEAVVIGRRVTAVEYYDVPKAKREGIANPYTKWRHDFSSHDGVLLGLPDGSVLIRSRSGRRLWGYR